MASQAHNLMGKPAGGCKSHPLPPRGSGSTGRHLLCKQRYEGPNPFFSTDRSARFGKGVLADQLADVVELGRHACLRSKCLRVCRFDSCHRHQVVGGVLERHTGAAQTRLGRLMRVRLPSPPPSPCGETAAALRLRRSVHGRAGATPATGTTLHSLGGTDPRSVRDPVRSRGEAPTDRGGIWETRSLEVAVAVMVMRVRAAPIGPN